MKIRSAINLLKPRATLLSEFEALGYNLDANCRDGFCGSCKVELLSGSVEYLKQPLAYLNEREILPCVCVRISELIDIEK